MNTCIKRMKNETLMWCSILLQLFFACAFALFVDYGSESSGANKLNSYHEVIGGTFGKNTLPNNYYMFQDVQVMMFIGFGFLLMLVKRADRNNMVASYFLVVAISLQWGTLCYGLFRSVNRKIHLDIKSLLNADLTCACVLISCAAVVDITTPLQLVFMAFFEIIFSSTNKWLGSIVLQASDVGSSMFVHVFGAYFGLAVNFVLQRNPIYKQLKKEASPLPPRSIISATVGTMFLWILWPSFNACLAENDAEQFRAIINTYYSLSASCVTAFAIWTLVYNCTENVNRQNFNTILFHNSTLVGGVVIGTSADMMINIWGSMIVGGLAGAGSVFVDRYFTEKATRQKIPNRDTWGVNTLHGIPGIVAGLVGAIVSAAATKEDYGFSLYRLFPARSPVNGSSEVLDVKYYHRKIQPGHGRSASEQAGYQIAALVVTLAISIIGGLGTGGVLSLPFFHDGCKKNDSKTDQVDAIVDNNVEEIEPITIMIEALPNLE